MPTAGTPSSRQAARTRVLICPFRTIVATSSVASSVTRRPSTKRLESPSRSDSWVAWGPPPCTSTTRMPTWCRMPICSTSARVESADVNASPPAFSTNTLRLYIRMYGTACRRAVTTIVRSVPLSRGIASSLNVLSFQHPIQHGHLHEHAVPRLADHYAARPVENAVRHDHAPAYRQAVHEAAVLARVVEPWLVHAPAGQL